MSADVHIAFQWHPGISACYSSWPFADDYKLLSFDELAEFIEENHHLPNIPSAQEVEEGGMAVGEMQRLQMEKIEELTLYMLSLKEELDAVKAENAELQDRLNAVEIH